LFPLDASEVASFARSFSQTAVQDVEETLRKFDKVKVGADEMLTVDQANELKRSLRVEAGTSLDFTSGEAGKAVVNAGLPLDAVIVNAFKEQAPMPIKSITAEAQDKLAQRFAPIIKTIVDQNETFETTTDTNERSKETTTSVSGGFSFKIIPKVALGITEANKTLERIEKATGLSNGRVTTSGEYVFDSIKLFVVDQQELLTAVSERATARSVGAPMQRKVWEISTIWNDQVLRSILDEASNHTTLAAERAALTVRVDSLEAKQAADAKEFNSLKATVESERKQNNQRIAELNSELSTAKEGIEALHKALSGYTKEDFVSWMYKAEKDPSGLRQRTYQSLAHFEGLLSYHKRRNSEAYKGLRSGYEKKWREYLKSKYKDENLLPFPW
jgi:hypothetical protein